MKNNVEFMAKASLGEKLETVIENLPSTEITLIDIFESIGEDSLLFLTIFLALVFLVPVSIPGGKHRVWQRNFIDWCLTFIEP